MKKIFGCLLLCFILVGMPLSSKAWTNDTPAAVLSIHAFGSSGAGSLLNAGHTWLTITNIMDEKLPFMGYEIPKGETISVSIWPDSMSDGYGGVYINREDLVYIDKEISCTTYGMRISMEKLNQIAANTPRESYYHDGQGNDWDLSDDLTHNCTTYSTEMWNLAADEDHQISDGMFDVDVPGTVANKIAKWNGALKETYQVAKRRYPKDVYYVMKDGTFGVLEKMVLSEENLELQAGEEKTLNAHFYSNESYYQTEEAKNFIQWESDNEEIATVTNGVVKGLKGGECTIKAYAEGAIGNLIYKECRVKVTEKSWQEAYVEAMQSYQAERGDLACRFTLDDLDGDGVPELFLSDGNFHMCQCVIYTWAQRENGEWEAISLGGYGSSGAVQYIPGDGIVLAGYMGQGFSISAYFRLTSGRIEQMEQFVRNTAGNPDVPPYQINDTEVTEEEFNSRQEKWLQMTTRFSTAVYDTMNDMTEENIALLLQGEYQNLVNQKNG